MKMYRDTENGHIISETTLKNEFNQLPDEEKNGRSFEQYINDCTNKNGFLEYEYEQNYVIKSKPLKINLGHKSYTISDLAKYTGVPRSTLYARIKRGVPLENLFDTKIEYKTNENANPWQCLNVYDWTKRNRP